MTSPAFPSVPLALVIASLAVSGAARAQCECDFTIGLEETSVDGSVLGVGPGDRVCVTAGERDYLRLQSFVGSAEAPVTVLNCGGVVHIRNEDRAYALVVEGSSRHFRITGTGDPAHFYGFRVSAPDEEPWAGVGVWLLDKSSDYEIDHMEIYETGFAGVSAKTDPLCDGSADQGVFVQRNTHLHHLWIHDTGGEGLYIGSTQSSGHTVTCDGVQETHQPHYLEEVFVHDNIIEDTGWDGAQIGMAHVGCRFHDNVIRRVGLSAVQYQQQGLQIGTYSSCEVYGNVIEDGPAMGIIVLGAGDTRIYNNVIRGFDGDGVYANARDEGAGKRYELLFNSIGDYGGNAITVFGGALGPSRAVNNVVVGPTPGISAGGDVDFTSSHNLVVADAAAAGLSSATDYRPVAGAVVLGEGLAIEGIETDLEGRDRPDPPAIGAYELDDGSGEQSDAGFDDEDGGQEPTADGGDSEGIDASPNGDDDGDGGGEGDDEPADGGSADDGASDAGTSDGGPDDVAGCSCGAEETDAPLAPLALLLFGLVRRRRGPHGER